MAVINFPKPGRGFGRQSNNDYLDEFDEFDEDYNNGFIDEDTSDEDYGETSEEAALRRQNKKSAMLKTTLRVVLAAIAVVAIGALAVYQTQTRSYTGASYSKLMDLTLADGTRYEALSGKLVAYSKDGASCYDTSGKQVWNITFEMQQPLASRAGGVLALCDYNGRSIYVVSAEKQLGSIATTMPVRAITVSESGEVAAVMEDSDITWVYLYAANGDTIAYFKTTMDQSGYPLGIAVSPDGTLVGVSHLTIGSEGASTSVAFYNFGSVGQNAVENNVSGFNFSNEIFPYIAYMNNDTAVAVSNARGAYFVGDEIPASGTNVMWGKEVQGVWSNDRYLVTLFTGEGAGAEHILQTYNAAGTQIGTIPFSLEYSSIQLVNDRVIISNAQECQIYTVQGAQKYAGEFDVNVKAIIPSSNSTTRFMLVTDDALEQMILE